MSDEYIVFHINGAPDKDIAATAVISSTKKAYPDKKIVVTTPFPEIWLHNPNVHRVYRMGATPYFYEDYIKGKKTKVFALDPYLTSDFIYKKKHLAEIWCDMVGVKYDGSLPQLFFTQREEEVAWRLTKTNEKLAIIQPFETYGAPGIVSTWTKDLPFDVAQKVVNAMRSAGYSVIQIKNPQQPSLAGVQNIALDLRLTLAVIKFTEKRLFVDSFAAQAAAALDKPSVVTWMATLPKLKGYDLHKNIFAKIDTALKEKLDGYSSVLDVTNKLAAENVDVSGAYDAEEIIKELNL